MPITIAYDQTSPRKSGPSEHRTSCPPTGNGRASAGTPNCPTIQSINCRAEKSCRRSFSFKPQGDGDESTAGQARSATRLVWRFGAARLLLRALQDYEHAFLGRRLKLVRTSDISFRCRQTQRQRVTLQFVNAQRDALLVPGLGRPVD